MKSVDRLNMLISEEEIASRVDALAFEIVKELGASATILVGLLNGSVVFLSDLMRRLYHHGLCLEVDFMIVSSYGRGVSSSGKLDVAQDIRLDIRGRTALLVDDIVDTGRTLLKTRDWLAGKGAKRVVTCALLDKPSRREVDIKPDFVGFEIDNVFVVGYGLDAGNNYRCLPYLAEFTTGDEPD